MATSDRPASIARWTEIERPEPSCYEGNDLDDDWQICLL
jgi:hypothetical protein